MARKTVEQDQIANAPVVDTPAAETPKPETPEQAAKRELEESVAAMFAVQFGGEDGAYVPTEGQAEWDPFVREQVLEADTLEAEYRSILGRKEANRTLLRAMAGMGKVPVDVANFYYTPKQKRAA